MKKQAKSFGLVLVILLLVIVMIAVSAPIKVSALSYSQENSTPTTTNTAQNTNVFQGYLYLSLIGKSGNTWKIRVFGPDPRMSYNITFEYSSYMCFLGDAKAWSNINSNHIKTVTTGIIGYQGVDIEITENFFADAIAVSYTCDDGKRYITSANLLNRFDYTMTQYQSVVKA